MEIAVVGATARRDARRDKARHARDRDHRARADDPARPRGRGGARRLATAARCRRGRSAAAAAAASRSPTSAPPPRTAARWPRSSPAARSKPRSRGPAASDVPVPASRRLRRCERVKVAATLTVNGVALPARARARTTPPARGARRGRPHRREGRLRRLRVRRLHDAARRQAGERVLVPGSAGRGPRGHDGRGPRRRRRAQPAPARRSSSTAASSAASARPAC